jgi:hypothetical protein
LNVGQDRYVLTNLVSNDQINNYASGRGRQ